MGCVHLYCGDGKGKTTAAIGLAVRAAGTGKQVVAARFLKTDQSGEVEILKRLPEVTLIPCEKTFGFTWKMTDEVKREAADYYKSMFETACREAVKRCGEAEENGLKALEENNFCETCDVLLVLDEVCASLSSGLLELADIVDFLDHRPADLEVVMTGRKPPEELLLRSDYVTWRGGELNIREGTLNGIYKEKASSGVRCSAAGMGNVGKTDGKNTSGLRGAE